jgi:hypothetical protein
MAWSYRIDLEKHRVVSVAVGGLEVDDIRAHMKAVGEDSDFRKDMDQLVDFTAVSQFGVSGEQIRRAAPHSPFGDGSRRAFVGSSDLMFGISRMFELSFSDKHGAVEVFRSVEEAERWLDEGGE